MQRRRHVMDYRLKLVYVPTKKIFAYGKEKIFKCEQFITQRMSDKHK